jgi:hypothetical protein
MATEKPKLLTAEQRLAQFKREVEAAKLKKENVVKKGCNCRRSKG